MDQPEDISEMLIALYKFNKKVFSVKMSLCSLTPTVTELLQKFDGPTLDKSIFSDEVMAGMAALEEWAKVFRKAIIHYQKFTRPALDKAMAAADANNASDGWLFRAKLRNIHATTISVLMELISHKPLYMKIHKILVNEYEAYKPNEFISDLINTMESIQM